MNVVKSAARMRNPKNVQLWELVNYWGRFLRVKATITNRYEPMLMLDEVGWVTYTHGAKVETESELVEL